MASAVLRNGRIVIVFSNGSLVGEPAGEGDSRSTIETKIRNALDKAYLSGKYKSKEIDGVNVPAAAASIEKQLKEPAARQAAPQAVVPKPKPQKIAPEARPAPKPEPKPDMTFKLSETEVAPAAKKPAPKREVREPAKPKTAGVSRFPAIRPVVRNQAWIDKQLGEMSKDETRMKAALDALHSNRAYVDMELSAGADPRAPRTERTKEQKAATAAVFNALLLVPKFRQALIAHRAMPEFGKLDDYLKSPAGRNGYLDASAGNAIIMAADMYIRYFMMVFVAHPQGGAKAYRDELMELPLVSERLKNIDGIRSYKPVEGVVPKPETVNNMIRQQLTEPINADTITAAALYIRRWELENPANGRARRSQNDMPLWKAPQAIVPPGEQKAAQPAAEPTPKTPIVVPAPASELERYAAANWGKLTEETYQNTMGGRPAALVMLSRNPGPEQRSVETALAKLGRDDIDRVMDRIFNETMKKGENFNKFCGSQKSYHGVPDETLDENTKPDHRRWVVRAAQEFINYCAKRTDEPYYVKFGQDLKFL
jgi:hypothetical protein